MIDEFSHKVANVFKVKIMRKIITVFNWVSRGKIFLEIILFCNFGNIFKEEKLKVLFIVCYVVKKEN